MKTIDRIFRALSSPNLFLRHINRHYHRQFGMRQYNATGIDIFLEDWDNLLLLDACRYDMFEAVNTIPGTLSSKISRASATIEFLIANFDKKDLTDTIYVTANPQLYRNKDRIDVQFHDVIHVWKEEGWNEKYGTVLPEVVTASALEAHNRYPNKRLLVHYLQPHYPFIGADTDIDKKHLTGEEDRENIWGMLMRKELDLSPEEIWEMYVENLEITLPSVEELILKLPGKTIVSSDHGNMVGERSFPIPLREWGHPHGIYTDQLVKVPWLTHEKDSRKQIVKEPSVEDEEETEQDVVKDRLRQLGYAE